MINGFVTGVPNKLLRLEALIMFVLSVAVYGSVGSGWLLFALLILVPDLSMTAFAVGPKLGTAIYNAFHWYGIPLVATGLGYFLGVQIFLSIGLIWISHISFDRVIGAGLKYEVGFRYSHLGIYGGKTEGEKTA